MLSQGSLLTCARGTCSRVADCGSHSGGFSSGTPFSALLGMPLYATHWSTVAFTPALRAMAIHILHQRRPLATSVQLTLRQPSADLRRATTTVGVLVAFFMVQGASRRCPRHYWYLPTWRVGHPMRSWCALPAGCRSMAAPTVARLMAGPVTCDWRAQSHRVWSSGCQKDVSLHSLFLHARALSVARRFGRVRAKGGERGGGDVDDNRGRHSPRRA